MDQVINNTGLEIYRLTFWEEDIHGHGSMIVSTILGKKETEHKRINRNIEIQIR